VGTITGGPKDTEPPRLLSSNPAMHTTNYTGNKIQLDFDEYILLKDISQQLNVSPPIKKQPVVKMKNKSLIIEYPDTLKENTTYTFNFGNSITDNNEGNVFPNFEFVFSTGAYIDSLGIRGQIINSFTLLPEKESILAMLYENLTDSTPFKETPMFTSRTDKNGNFFINNVKPGTYRLCALKDDNYNYKYDPETELFAFADTLIILNITLFDKLKPVVASDSTNKNNLRKRVLSKIDSLKKDSLSAFRNSIYTSLKLFSQTDKKQYIKDYSWKDKHVLQLIFNRSLLNDTLSFEPKFLPAKNWYLIEKNKTSDTIMFWITDTTILKTDSISINVKFTASDSKGNYIDTTETLNYRYFSKDAGKKKKETVATIPVLPLKMNISNGAILDFGSKILLEVAYPIDSVNSEKLQLFLKKDTVYQPHVFELKNIKNKRNYTIAFKHEEEQIFKLLMLPGFFEDIYGLVNDTIETEFKIQKEAYYGSLSITLSNVKSNIIVQLIDEEKVLSEKTIAENGIVLFKYLQPKEYTIKFIYDNNKNGIWDTGNYLLNQQPEKVLFYKENVNVRSNWDVEINWKLE
jgi:hypothetical protein